MLFEPTLEQLRAAGEETRLRVLCLLRRGDLTVTELTRCLGQLQPRVSRHLRILVDADLVTPYQEGSWRFYKLSGLPTWLEALIDGLSGSEVATILNALDEIRADRARRAAQYFAANASDWDALRRLHTDDAEIERALLGLAPEKVGDFVDLGTGTGRMLIVFADRYDHAVGYDASPEMLAVARVRLDEAGASSATVRRQDILKPDQIPPSSADLICIHHVLHFLGEPQRAIAVAADTLRPGGTLLIADFGAHNLEMLRDLFEHRRLGFSSDEVRSYAEAVGLILTREESLEPGPDGNLTSLLWRLDKPRSPSEKVRLLEAGNA